MNRKLNSDGQQLHQYQQNEQSPHTLTHWTQKNTTYYHKKEWQHKYGQYNSRANECL